MGSEYRKVIPSASGSIWARSFTSSSLAFLSTTICSAPFCRNSKVIPLFLSMATAAQYKSAVPAGSMAAFTNSSDEPQEGGRWSLPPGCFSGSQSAWCNNSEHERSHNVGFLRPLPEFYLSARIEKMAYPRNHPSLTMTLDWKPLWLAGSDGIRMAPQKNKDWKTMVRHQF